MPGLDLSLFAKSNPEVLDPQVDLAKIRYSDLVYTVRIEALLRATRDMGKALDKELFNELLNGYRSVAYVQDVISKL